MATSATWIDWLNLLVQALTLLVFVASIRFLGRQIREQQRADRAAATADRARRPAGQQGARLEPAQGGGRAVAGLFLGRAHRGAAAAGAVRRLVRPGAELQDAHRRAAARSRPTSSRCSTTSRASRWRSSTTSTIATSPTNSSARTCPRCTAGASHGSIRCAARAGDPSIFEALETLSRQWELRNRDIADVVATETWREGKAPT